MPQPGTALKDKFARPVRDLRISVIDRCNFRCPHCMPVSQYPEHYRFLESREWLGFAEILRVARILVGQGVTKLRLTGGEPLLRPALPDLVHELARLTGIDDLALTTNGVLLPRLAGPLRAAGLGRVTVSLDSLDERVFLRMSGDRGSRQQVMDGIKAAEAAGLPAKINVVVRKGVNEHTVLPLLRAFRGTGHILRFIEYMDVGTLNDWRPEEVLPAQELVERIHARWPLEPLDQNYHGEVAKRYAFTDGGGEIGFVTSVSEPFCGSCGRIRLSADGRLYTCLFAHHGTDLRTPLRRGADDEELLAIIKGVWLRRTDRYSEQRAGKDRTRRPVKKIEMYRIGG